MRFWISVELNIRYVEFVHSVPYKQKNPHKGDLYRIKPSLWIVFSIWCGWPDSNRHGITPSDFKSLVNTYSTTPAILYSIPFSIYAHVKLTCSNSWDLSHDSSRDYHFFPYHMTTTVFAWYVVITTGTTIQTN